MQDSNIKADEKGSGAQRVLLLIVVGMGFALIGGAALLIGKIMNKAEACTLEALELPANARILGADGDRLSALVTGEDGQEILRVYELCRGGVAREVVLVK
jgi:hypothetical protein